MTVDEYINLLSKIELKPIAKQHDTILALINYGITALHVKFPILIKDYIIDLSENITEYKLPNDVVLIEGIFDEDGNEFSLNNPLDYSSIQQTSFNEIQVPNPVNGASISVIYRATPAPIVNTAEELPLPAYLIDALSYYVAMRYYMTIDINEDQQHIYYKKYDYECKYIEALGLIPKPRLDALVINENSGIDSELPIYE